MRGRRQAPRHGVLPQPGVHRGLGTWGVVKGNIENNYKQWAFLPLNNIIIIIIIIYMLILPYLFRTCIEENIFALFGLLSFE